MGNKATITAIQGGCSFFDPCPTEIGRLSEEDGGWRRKRTG